MCNESAFKIYNQTIQITTEKINQLEERVKNLTKDLLLNKASERQVSEINGSPEQSTPETTSGKKKTLNTVKRPNSRYKINSAGKYCCRRCNKIYNCQSSFYRHDQLNHKRSMPVLEVEKVDNDNIPPSSNMLRATTEISSVPYQEYEINGKRIQALLDSGSNFSVISWKLLTEEQKLDIKRQKYKETLETANGGKIKIIGKQTLTFGFDDFLFDADFRITKECVIDCIIGFDIIKELEKRRLRWTRITPFSRLEIRHEWEISQQIIKTLDIVNDPEQDQDVDSTLNSSGTKDTEPLLKTTPLKHPRGTITVDLKKPCSIMMCSPYTNTNKYFNLKILFLGILIGTLIPLILNKKYEDHFSISKDLKFTKGIFRKNGVFDVYGIKMFNYKPNMYYQCPYGTFWRGMPLHRSVLCNTPKYVKEGWKHCYWIGAQCVCNPHKAPDISDNICLIGIPMELTSTPKFIITAALKMQTQTQTMTIKTTPEVKSEIEEAPVIEIIPSQHMFRFVPLELQPVPGSIGETSNVLDQTSPSHGRTETSMSISFTTESEKMTKTLKIVILVFIYIMSCSLCLIFLYFVIYYCCLVKQVTETNGIFKRLRRRYRTPSLGNLDKNMEIVSTRSQVSLHFENEFHTTSPLRRDCIINEVEIK